MPTPSALLGYEPGTTHTTFRDQEQVLLAIAEAARDRVRVVTYGKSVEGRPLRLFLISAPENIHNLETIRTQNLLLADPRKLTSAAQADTLLQSAPAITWINECIHGDETASFEAAMWTVYTLAASESADVRDALAKSVVVVNPVFNPDGHERFVVYYNSVALGNPDSWAFEKDELWAVYGRFNHYRFDMNRDKLAMSQPEVRQETAAYLRWFPHVFVDQHGEVDPYFFPPDALEINEQTDAKRVEKWTDIFGRANAAAFDKHGWQYVTRDVFDLFYPGYLDSWTTLSGAIGMTYETDGGHNLARRSKDGTVLTLRDGALHHFTTALATIETAATNRQALVRDFYTYRRDTIEAGKTERLRRVVVLPGSDPNRLAQLAANLLRVGVEVQETTAPFTSQTAHAYLPPLSTLAAPTPDSKSPTPPNTSPANPANPATFPVGSLVIEMSQAQGRVAKAFLEPDAPFHSEFLKEQKARRDRNEKKNENEAKEDYGFYDITAWALPFTYGVAAYWTEDAPAIKTRPVVLNAQGEAEVAAQSGGIVGGQATTAYVFPYDRDNAAILALRLLQEDFRLTAATKPTRIGGREWQPGTIIIRVARNPERLAARLDTLAKALGVVVTPVNSAYSDNSPTGLGASSIITLHKPSIAVIADDNVQQSSYGAVWHLLERVGGLQFTALRVKTLRNVDMSRFNVLIFPDGGDYMNAVTKAGAASLRIWLERGNVVIGLGGGGLWFTEKDAEFTTATVVGADDTTDSKVKEDKPKEDAKEAGKEVSKETRSGDKPKPKKPIALPGSIFRATIDTAHFLGYGYSSGDLAVPLEGETFLKPTTKGANVVRFGKANLRVSGWAWEGNTEALLVGTSYVIDEPIGGGHALLFAQDPTSRALWVGLRKMFFSGILFAPARSPLSEARE